MATAGSPLDGVETEIIKESMLRINQRIYKDFAQKTTKVDFMNPFTLYAKVVRFAPNFYA